MVGCHQTWVKQVKQSALLQSGHNTTGHKRRSNQIPFSPKVSVLPVSPLKTTVRAWFEEMSITVVHSSHVLRGIPMHLLSQFQLSSVSGSLFPMLNKHKKDKSGSSLGLPCLGFCSDECEHSWQLSYLLVSTLIVPNRPSERLPAYTSVSHKAEGSFLPSLCLV